MLSRYICVSRISSGVSPNYSKPLLEAFDILAFVYSLDLLDLSLKICVATYKKRLRTTVICNERLVNLVLAIGNL
jgi:hypothetical protein